MEHRLWDTDAWQHTFSQKNKNNLFKFVLSTTKASIWSCESELVEYKEALNTKIHTAPTNIGLVVML